MDQAKNDCSEKWIKTHCARFDHGGCGLKVLIKDQRAVRVVADESNPRSAGYSCPKGMASIERLYHPQRLTHPLIRKGEGQQAGWEKISWDQALDYALHRLERVKQKSGPQAIAFAQGAPKGLEYLMLMRLANVMGVPNIASTQHVCHWPRELMGRITCGFLPIPDYEKPTQCIVVWGSNPLQTNEEGMLGILFQKALKRNRPQLIVIDPYQTEVAQKADLWLQIKPGSDDLLALGFLKIILNEKWYDENFVRDWTTGLDDFKHSLRDHTLEGVAEGTWLPKEKIYLAAKLYAQSRPAMIQWGNAIENNSTRVSQTCRSLVLLMAITGNLDSPGGNIQAPIPSVMSLKKFIGDHYWPDPNRQSINSYYHISPMLPLVPGSILIRTILDEKPYPIRALFIQGSNPLITYAGSADILKALKKLEFIMVSDLFMTPTAALADMVLPVATNMEFNDIGHYGLPHGYVLARPKIVDPPGEAWPDIKILNELGKRLGRADLFWTDTDHCLEEIIAPAGIDYEQFCQIGILKGEKKYYEYKDKGFRTPTGKIELNPPWFKKGVENPSFQSPNQPEGDGLFPLLLINAKPRYFFHSGYRQIESLRKSHEMPGIRIHPEAASKFGINEGDRVQVTSPQGQIHLTAKLTRSLHPKVVMADYGWWFPELGEDQLYGWREANINVLTSADPPYDPLLGTTPLRSIPCRIEKDF